MRLFILLLLLLLLLLCIKSLQARAATTVAKKNLNSSSCQSLFHIVQILQLKPHQLQRKVNLFFLSHTQKTYCRALITFKLRQVNFSMNLSFFLSCIIFFQIVFPIWVLVPYYKIIEFGSVRFSKESTNKDQVAVL
jgi:hypothetical protein